MTPSIVRCVRYPTLVVSLVASLACEGGQIGGEVQDHGEPPCACGPACEQVGSTPLAPESTTDLGFAGQRLLDLVAGQHAAMLAWGGDDSYQDEFALIPAAGDSRIVARVTPDRASLRLVEFRASEDSADACRDELRVDAQAEVTTDNGALNDALDVTFSTRSAHYAESSAQLVPGELAGSFALTPLGIEAGRIEPATLSLKFAPGAFSGRITGSIVRELGATASLLAVVYAAFPPESCESGAVVGVDSEFAAELTAVLDGVRDFALVWSGGDSTELTLSHDVTRICLNVAGDSGGDWIDLQVAAKAFSTDGRVNGTWSLAGHMDLGVDGEPSALVLTRRSFSLGDPLAPQQLDASQFEVETGISGVILSAESPVGLDIRIEARFDDEARASGTLTVTQSLPDQCEEWVPVEMPEGSGQETLVCESFATVERESATLTARE